MKGNVAKAYEITDARIQFVSLVGKAANKHTFLITKGEDGEASFTTYGKIVKADAESHYVTGIVYEPMTEDTDGNFMTEDEITKACHWFMKNGNKVDLQHSFEPLEQANVVESWIAKSEYEIEGNAVKKGTWLMTVEVQDDGIWDAIQKGEITGFSMGGLGTYSEEDVDLESVNKQDKKGLLKQLANVLGFNVVSKGQVTEIYEEQTKADRFWNAFDALEGVLRQYDWTEDKTVYETDEDTIREALAEFGEIITAILTDEEPIAKSLYQARPKEAVGKSEEPAGEDNPEAEAGDGVRKEMQDGEDDTNNNLEKEECEMKKEEVEAIVNEAIRKAMEPDDEPETTEESVEKADEAEAEENTVTQETIEKMVNDAVEKALKPETEEDANAALQEMVNKAVAEAVEPILKARGLPTNLNGETTGEIKKDETHFLHGIL